MIKLSLLPMDHRSNLQQNQPLHRLKSSNNLTLRFKLKQIKLINLTVKCKLKLLKLIRMTFKSKLDHSVNQLGRKMTLLLFVIKLHQQIAKIMWKRIPKFLRLIRLCKILKQKKSNSRIYALRPSQWTKRLTWRSNMSTITAQKNRNLKLWDHQRKPLG